MITNCLVIGAGGAIGAIFRYLLSLTSMQGKGGFPFATLLTNILGALLIGIVMGLTLQGHQLDERLSLFLRVGICGGFTTFSTFALETTTMLSEGKILMGVGYMVLSTVLAVLAAFIGEMVVA